MVHHDEQHKTRNVISMNECNTKNKNIATTNWLACIITHGGPLNNTNKIQGTFSNRVVRIVLLITINMIYIVRFSARESFFDRQLRGDKSYYTSTRVGR